MLLFPLPSRFRFTAFSLPALRCQLGKRGENMASPFEAIAIEIHHSDVTLQFLHVPRWQHTIHRFDFLRLTFEAVAGKLIA